MSVVANVAINVDSRDAVTKLRQVEQASNKLDQTYQDLNGRLRDANGRFIKAGDAAQAASGKVNLLTGSISKLTAGLAVADLARRYFKGFDEAEKAAAAVRTLGVDSKTLEGQLLGVSNKLGGLYSQTQLLTAAYDVASSGFANAADNAKILEASAKGATAGLSDINTVGNALTSVLNAYGKSANEAATLVDGFIQTQNDGKIVLNEYAQQIGKLAPTAAAAGIGIQELNAAVATITAQGVPVESTFAGLNQALVSILKPSKEASDLAKALGIDFNEAGLRAKGFGGLLQEVKEKTGGSTTALVQLFGSVDALKAVLPLVNDDLVKYNQNVQKQANVSGIADKATKELGGTVSAEVSKMINQIGNLTRSLDTVLGPALGGIVRLINVVIAEATKGIQVLGQLFSMSPNATLAKQAVASGQLGNVGRVLPGIDELIGAKRRQQLQRQAGAGTGLFGLGMDQSKFVQLLQKEPAFRQQAPSVKAPAAAVVDPRVQAVLDQLEAGSSGRKGKSDAEKAAEKAAREAEKLANELQRSLEAGDQLGTQFSRQAILLDEASEIERQRLQIQFDYEDRAKQIAELKNAEQRLNLTQLNDEIRRLEIIDLQTEALKKQAEEAEKLFKEAMGDAEFGVAGQGTVASGLSDAIAKLKEDLNPVKLQIDPIVNGATAIGAAFSTAFGEVITGAKSTQEALADAFKGIGQAFISMAVEIIAKQMTLIILQSIFNALSGAGGALGTANKNLTGTGALKTTIPGFAIGGRATGGPVTGNTPYVVGERGPELFVPGTGGTIVNNRDLRSAMVSAPGASGAPVLNMSFQSTNIGGVEYVSRDQLEAAMAATRKAAANDGARQGTAATLSKLQQSPSTRAKLGLR